MKIPKSKKHLTFIAEKIDFSKNNLFDDIYNNSYYLDEVVTEIEILQKTLRKIFLKLGECYYNVWMTGN